MSVIAALAMVYVAAKMFAAGQFVLGVLFAVVGLALVGQFD